MARPGNWCSFANTSNPQKARHQEYPVRALSCARTNSGSWPVLEWASLAGPPAARVRDWQSRWSQLLARLGPALDPRQRPMSPAMTEELGSRQNAHSIASGLLNRVSL